MVSIIEITVEFIFGEVTLNNIYLKQITLNNNDC